MLLVPPTLVAVAPHHGGPGGEVWPGGATLLSSVSFRSTLAARELSPLLVSHHLHPQADGSSHASVVALPAIICSAAVLFFGRCITVILVVPAEQPLTTMFGRGVVTLLTTILLPTMSFFIITILREQQQKVVPARRTVTPSPDCSTGRASCTMRRRRFMPRGNTGTSGSLIRAARNTFRRFNTVPVNRAGNRALFPFPKLLQHRSGGPTRSL